MEDENSSYAKLVPVNGRARSLFADAVSKAQSENNELQLRFYADDTLHLRAQLPDSTPTPFDPETAFARLAIAPSRLPQFPSIGWRVGKEARNVDICIAIATGTKASLQFRIYIHPSSGLLMLQAGPSRQYHMSLADDAQEWTELTPGQVIVLLNPVNAIRLAECEFQICYTVPKSRREPFFKILDDFLSEYHKKGLHRAGRANPSTGLRNRCGKYVTGGSLGFGAFGDIKYGVDSESGNPVALKDVRILNSGWRRELCNEITIMEDLKDSPLFLHLMECWCEVHNCHPRECPGRGIEHFFLATELALYDFGDPVFLNVVPYDQVLRSYQQTLLALKYLDSQGIMHRDLTRSNMFVVSLNPPRAVIGDFGKAIRRLTDTQTAIGPTSKCAPEVWLGTGYSNTIDLWSWAYAAAEHLGYSPRKGEHYNKITRERVSEIHEMLSRAKAEKPHIAAFVDLISKILVWEREKRIGLEQALRHDVWKEILSTDQSGLESEPETRVAKKAKTRSNQTTAYKTVSTKTLSSEEP